MVSCSLVRGGTRWCSWMTHCATSRKVAGSIPDGVIGIFHWHNPFGRTQPLTGVPGMFPGRQRRSVRRADNLTTSMCRLSWNRGASTSWNPLGLSRLVMGLLCFGSLVKKIIHICTGRAQMSGARSPWRLILWVVLRVTCLFPRILRYILDIRITCAPLLYMMNLLPRYSWQKNAEAMANFFRTSHWNTQEANDLHFHRISIWNLILQYPVDVKLLAICVLFPVQLSKEYKQSYSDQKHYLVSDNSTRKKHLTNTFTNVNPKNT